MYAGRYQLRKELGRGQYGKVYLARDMQMDLGHHMVNKAKVAVKIVMEMNHDEIETLIFE